jgi:hypothetical protein
MFDRFKKSVFGNGDQPAKDEHAEPARPAPGGFGRRQTPVNGAAHGDTPPPAPASTGFGRRSAPVADLRAQTTTPAAQPQTTPAAQPQTTPAAQPQTTITTVKGDNAIAQIHGWVMTALRDGRGIHCETALAVVGALGGFAAQQAIWEGMVKPGLLTKEKAFTVARTTSGEEFYFGDAINMALASTSPKVASFWSLVAGGAQSAGARQLPDIAEIFKNSAETVGTEAFGIPRLPPQYMPKPTPRRALNECWPHVHAMLKATPPGTWAMQLGVVAQRMIVEMKDVVPPEMAAKILMEAAVPMSKVDPKTVPTSTTH